MCSSYKQLLLQKQEVFDYQFRYVKEGVIFTKGDRDYIEIIKITDKMVFVNSFYKGNNRKIAKNSLINLLKEGYTCRKSKLDNILSKKNI